MPQTMIKETTVYTLEELKSLGWRAHETALQKVKEWNWECWEPSFYSDDVRYLIGEEWPIFELSESTLEWSTNPDWIRGKGSMDVVAYMRNQKLCNKFRALYDAITRWDLERSVAVSFGFGRDTDMTDIERCIDYDIEGLEYKSPRYNKLMAQLDALGRDIDNYMGNVEDRLLKNLRAEEEYRYSDEYAKGTIESYDLKFTEDGDIDWG